MAETFQAKEPYVFCELKISLHALKKSTKTRSLSVNISGPKCLQDFRETHTWPLSKFVVYPKKIKISKKEEYSFSLESLNPIQHGT